MKSFHTGFRRMLILLAILPAMAGLARGQSAGLFDIFDVDVELEPFSSPVDHFSIQIPPGFKHTVKRSSETDVSHRFEGTDHHYAVVITDYPGEEIADYVGELAKLKDLTKDMNRIFGGETVSVTTTTEGGLVSHQAYIIDKEQDRKTHLRLYSWKGRIITVLVHGKTSLVTTDESNAVLDSFQFTRTFFDPSKSRLITLERAGVQLKIPPVSQVMKAGKESPGLNDAVILQANDPHFGIQMVLATNDQVDPQVAAEYLAGRMFGVKSDRFSAVRSESVPVTVHELPGSEVRYQIGDVLMVTRSFPIAGKEKRVTLVSSYPRGEEQLAEESQEFLDSIQAR